MTSKKPEETSFPQPTENRGNLEELLNELPVGLISFDTLGNIFRVNSFLLGLLGSPSEKATKNINMLTFPPLVSSGISGVIKQAITDGKTYSIEAPYYSKWGKSLFLRFKAIPYTDNEGKVIGCHATVEDATTTVETRNQLERKNMKEKLVSNISSKFINSTFKDIDREIHMALEQMAGFLSAERAVLFLITEDNRYVIKTHEWRSDNVRSFIKINEKVPKEKLVPKQLEELDIVSILDVQQLPDEQILKKTLTEINIASVVLVPLSYRGVFKGFIGIDSVIGPKEWDDNTFHLAKLIGEMIINLLERKNTESLLLEKEKEYEEVINAIDAIIWKADVDREGKFTGTYISSSVDDILQLPPGSIENDWDKYFSYIHPDDLQNVNDTFQQAFQNPGSFFNADYRLVKNGGEIVWVNSNGTAHVLKDGTLRVFGTSTNVTERKNAEEEISRNEKKYRSLFEQSNDAIFLNRINGDIVDVNEKACEIFGYSKEVFRRMNVVELLAPEHKSAGRLGMEQFKEDGFVNVHTVYSKSNGETFDAEVNAKVLEGYTDLAQAIVKDVSEQKRAEEEIIRSENKYRSLFEQSNDAIIIHDENGVIMDANEMTCDVLGYRQDELKRMSLMDLIIPEERDDIWNGITKLRTRGSIRKELRMLCSNGTIVHMDVSASLLRGQYGLIQSVGRDISDRIKAEKAMLNAKIEAETANRIKSEFLANMSHELRTPLNSVIGFSDMLAEGYAGHLEEKQKKYVQNVSQSGKYLLTLINNILDIAKIESGKVELDPEYFSVEEVFGDAENLISHLARKKHITLIVDKPECFQIYADKLKLKQIIYNLLSNAIKFTPEHGEVRLSATAANNEIRISVRDNGIGIAKEDYEEVFKPFRQLESSLSRQYVGTGLGLSIVKKLVELHCGSITVESEPDKGSNFTFTIPIIPLAEEHED